MTNCLLAGAVILTLAPFLWIATWHNYYRVGSEWDDVPIDTAYYLAVAVLWALFVWALYWFLS